MSKNIKIKAEVKVKTYSVIAEAVDSGINYGWNRAHKHTSLPGEDAIKREIYDGVMMELGELLIFPELE
jgi:hypothetical protein